MLDLVRLLVEADLPWPAWCALGGIFMVAGCIRLVDERARRRTYEVVLSRVEVGTVLIDRRRGKRTLMVVRIPSLEHDHRAFGPDAGDTE